MLLRQLVSTVAQQLLCACITADMRMHNTCCACGGQLLCANNYPDLFAHPLSSLTRKYRNLDDVIPAVLKDINTDSFSPFDL